jgi:hypothetical protein
MPVKLTTSVFRPAGTVIVKAPFKSVTAPIIVEAPFTVTEAPVMRSLLAALVTIPVIVRCAKATESPQNNNAKNIKPFLILMYKLNLILFMKQLFPNMPIYKHILQIGNNSEYKYRKKI